VLRDYKFTSVYTSGKTKPEWEAQVNIYAWMWRQHGFPVDRAQLVLLYRDWRKREFERSQSYPIPVEIVDVPLWTDQDVLAKVTYCVRGHQYAETLADDEITICTPEERWERGGAWAVMKRGRKSAVKLCETEEQAQAVLTDLAASQRGDFYLEQRAPEQVRCLYFCNVRPFCVFGRNLKGGEDES
jgi:hypothetical protein